MKVFPWYYFSQQECMFLSKQLDSSFTMEGHLIDQSSIYKHEAVLRVKAQKWKHVIIIMNIKFGIYLNQWYIAVKGARFEMVIRLLNKLTAAKIRTTALIVIRQSTKLYFDHKYTPCVRLLAKSIKKRNLISIRYRKINPTYQLCKMHQGSIPSVTF